MNHSILLAALLLPAGLAAPALAQIQIPINPKASYLRTYTDPSAVPAAAVPLSALGTGPGQWLNITTVGGFYNGGGVDNVKALACVFSSSSVLQADGIVHRVLNPIPAGTSFASSNTYYGNVTTDIAEDFLVSNSLANGTLVKVPPGATHIFFAIPDNYYSHNTDPNNDYFVVFSPGVPATMQGTAEDCELRTGISTTTTVTPDVKTAVPFTTIYATIHQRYGISAGQLYLLAFDVFPTAGAPPLEVLPGIRVGPNFAVLQFGLVSATPAQWSVFVSPGYAGDTLILQAAFLSDTARNGLLVTSDAHQIQLL